MIYIVFTEQGLEDALADIGQVEAQIWANSGLIDEQESPLQQNISLQCLPENADPENEKSVLKALKYVESQTSDKEIYVEYL